MAIFYPSRVTDFHGSEGEKLVYEALHRLSNDYMGCYSFRWLGTITQRRSEGRRISWCSIRRRAFCPLR